MVLKSKLKKGVRMREPISRRPLMLCDSKGDSFLSHNHVSQRRTTSEGVAELLHWERQLEHSSLISRAKIKKERSRIVVFCRPPRGHRCNPKQRAAQVPMALPKGAALPLANTPIWPSEWFRCSSSSWQLSLLVSFALHFTYPAMDAGAFANAARLVVRSLLKLPSKEQVVQGFGLRVHPESHSWFASFSAQHSFPFVLGECYLNWQGRVKQSYPSASFLRSLFRRIDIAIAFTIKRWVRGSSRKGITAVFHPFYTCHLVRSFFGGPWLYNYVLTKYYANSRFLGFTCLGSEYA